MRVVRITDITQAGELRHEEPAFVPKDTRELDDYELRDGDVLIARSGATAGKSYVHRSFGERAVFAGYLIRFQPDTSKVSPRFIGAFLQTVDYWRQLNSHQRTVAQPNVNAKQLASLLLPVPPLAEQERIVKLRDEADELRKLRTQADRRTAALLPALFHEMFGDPASNPDSWPVRRLEDVVYPGRIVTYGIVQAGPNVPEGIPYIRTGDRKDGAIKVDALFRTSPEVAASYRRSEVATGDIVMSIRATVGTTAVVPLQPNGANLTQGTARISPGPDILTDYLLWFLRIPQTQSWIQGQVKGATFREITPGSLRQLPVMIPPLPLQQEFAQRVAEIREMEATQAASRHRLDALFQSMLHRAFNGES